MAVAIGLGPDREPWGGADVLSMPSYRRASQSKSVKERLRVFVCECQFEIRANRSGHRERERDRERFLLSLPHEWSGKKSR